MPMKLHCNASTRLLFGFWRWMVYRLGGTTGFSKRTTATLCSKAEISLIIAICYKIAVSIFWSSALHRCEHLINHHRWWQSNTAASLSHYDNNYCWCQSVYTISSLLYSWMISSVNQRGMYSHIAALIAMVSNSKIALLWIYFYFLQILSAMFSCDLYINCITVEMFSLKRASFINLSVKLCV